MIIGTIILFLFLSTVQSENESTTISPTTRARTNKPIIIKMKNKPCPCPKISDVTESNCQEILECMEKNPGECDEVDGAWGFVAQNCCVLYFCELEKLKDIITETAAKKKMSVDQFKLTLPRDNDSKRDRMLITPQCLEDLDKEKTSSTERCKNASPVMNCVKTIYKKEKCYKAKMEQFAHFCKALHNITVDPDDNGKATRGFALNYFTGIVIALLML